MIRTFRYLGFGAFMGSLALFAWWWLRPAASGTGTPRATAAVADALLFSVFALHHSVAARPAAQRWLTRIVPPDLMRTAYVWTASLLFAGVCLAWQHVGGQAWNVSGTPALFLRLLQGAGIVLVIAAARRIRLGELAGLMPPDPNEPLHRDGPYAVVRHPIYLGWVLIFCTEPHMTMDRLVLALLSSSYLAAAVPFEEAGLRRQFGAGYDDYRSAVRWRILPFVY
jgi:protein-S-isoprenylcysteine O-methyltransferase Ste14